MFSQPTPRFQFHNQLIEFICRVCLQQVHQFRAIAPSHQLHHKSIPYTNFGTNHHLLAKWVQCNGRPFSPTFCSRSVTFLAPFDLPLALLISRGGRCSHGDKPNQEERAPLGPPFTWRQGPSRSRRRPSWSPSSASRTDCCPCKTSRSAGTTRRRAMCG